MIKNEMRPIHPGEILREEYLGPLGMSVNALAQRLRVPATRIHEIVKERRAVTADTAMRLARYFGGDAQSWLNLQSAFELRQAEINPDRTAIAFFWPQILKVLHYAGISSGANDGPI